MFCSICRNDITYCTCCNTYERFCRPPKEEGTAEKEQPLSEEAEMRECLQVISLEHTEVLKEGSLLILILLR